MFRLSWSSLRARLMLLIGVAVIPALGLMLFTAVDQRRQAAVDVQTNALRLARLAAANQERVIEGAHQLLIALAQFPDVLQRDPLECGTLMANILAAHPFFANLGGIAPDGRWICSAKPLSQLASEADSSWFQHALRANGFTIGDYQVSAAGSSAGKAIVNFAYPVNDATGHTRALMVATLDLAWLNQLAAQIELPTGATLMLVGSDGIVLARYPDAARWVGHSVPESPIIKAVLNRQAEGTDQTAGLDGVSRLFAFTPLKDNGQSGEAYIVVGIPVQTAFAEVDRVWLRNLAGSGGVAVLILIAVWGGSELFVLRHVKALIKTTEQLAQGDLSARIALVDRGSEFGQLAQAFNQMAEASEEKRAENARLLEAVQHLAITDDLTGLYNRRQFFVLAEREFARAQRFREPLSAIMLDLDNFKQINDVHGHAAGDQVLRTVAQRCAVTIREVDILGRYGGDEFTLVLPGTTPAAAHQLAERLRQRIAEPIEIGSTALMITASLGVVGLTEASLCLANLLEQADAALYRAKVGGRNRVEVETTTGPQDQTRATVPWPELDPPE